MIVFFAGSFGSLYYYLAMYFVSRSGQGSEDLEISLQCAAFGAGAKTGVHW
jgi:hypothetical protein